MYRSKGSNNINNLLNRIEKDITNCKNSRAHLKTLQELNVPYFNYRIQNDIGTIYMNLGMFDDALKCFEKLIKEDPSYHTAYKITKLLLVSGEVDKAKYFVSLLPDDENRYYFEGYIEKAVGNYDKAIEKFSKLRFTLMEVKGLLQMGHCYKNMFDYESAKKMYNKLPASTDEKYESLVALLEIALDENDENINKLIKQFDVDNCKLYRVLKEYRRCVSYYMYKNNKLNSKMSKYYFEGQLLKYNKEKAIKHIQDRHVKKKDYRFQFMEKVDINEIFNYCLDHLESKISTGSSDKYLIDYPSDIGFLNNNKTNRIYVSTIPNTKNILTLYPIVNYDRILEKEKDDENVR